MLPPFASTTDAALLGFEVEPQHLLRASTRIRTYLRSAGHPVEITAPQDDLIELCCQIAKRIGTPNEPLEQGVQQQTAPGFSVGYGWDAWKAQSGLTAGELQTLARMYPAIPGCIVLGPVLPPE